MKMLRATTPADQSRHLGRRRRRERFRPHQELLEARTLLSSLGFTVDNLDPGYVETGPSWITAWGTSGFEGGYRTNSARANNATASWTLRNLPAARYAVYTTFVNNPYVATNTPFTILDGTKTVASMTLNEQLAANDDQAGGVGWKSLGTSRCPAGR